jgi:hypothetical protein
MLVSCFIPNIKLFNENEEMEIKENIKNCYFDFSKHQVRSKKDDASSPSLQTKISHSEHLKSIDDNNINRKKSNTQVSRKDRSVKSNNDKKLNHTNGVNNNNHHKDKDYIANENSFSNALTAVSNITNNHSVAGLLNRKRNKSSFSSNITDSHSSSQNIDHTGSQKKTVSILLVNINQPKTAAFDNRVVMIFIIIFIDFITRRLPFK